MKQPFRALGNDLFFDMTCTCPSDLFKGSEIEHLMKHKVKLTGYYDDFFFDEVNKEPRETECKCGRKIKYQWFRDGVDAKFI